MKRPRSVFDPEKNAEVAAKLVLPFSSGWLALIASSLLAIYFVIGVVAKVTGNENLANGLGVLAIFIFVAWVPLSLLAILLSPKSSVARIGCLLPIVTYVAAALLMIYVFN